MNANLKWKAVLILFVILACLYGLFGRPQFPTSLEQARANLGERIKLGLDLRGGIHLIVQVQVEEAVSQAADISRNQLLDQMRDRQIRYGSSEKIDNTRFVIRGLGEGQSSAFRDLVTQQLGLGWEVGVAAGEANSYTLSMTPAEAARIRSETLRQAVETIDRRVNALGLTEPTIALHGRGENEILVEVPGEGDPGRIKSVIKAGGQLELRLVRGEREFSSQADCYANYQGILPPGTECVEGKQPPAQPGQPAPVGDIWYLLERVPAVTGRELRTASPQPSSDGIPGRFDVSFTLSVQAGQAFGRFTENNIGNRMAIVLDGNVQSAPVIQGKITTNGQIEGNFGREEASTLALVLRSGSLPASIRYLEERTVGPSLGADSIRKGLQASAISLIVVMVFMLFYYKKAGINANVALILNLVILMACLAYFGASLTLPGIAGVILTIGMGVDSNVLIFERIREELRGGKASASAVETGFNRAFLTIIDTHVTTIVSCFFLFMFGTGPVRGFAITLTIGLLANLFTAIYVSRALFHWYIGRMQRGAALSI